MKKILLLATAVVMSLAGFSQLVSIGWEVVQVHDNTTYTDVLMPSQTTLDGYTTYRLFAYCTNPDDYVTNVYGDLTNPVYVGPLQDGTTCDALFQHTSGGATGPVNDALFNVAPLLEYDSFVTLGWHFQSESASSGSISTVEDAVTPSPWIQPFEDGSPISMNTNVGGSWFVPLSLDNDFAFAGDDLKVCLGQFTSTCELEALVNVQVFTNGVQPTPDNPYDPVSLGVFTCTSACSPGCIDSEATNFCNTCDIDDGSCIYPCDLVISNLNITDVACTGFNTGEVEVEIEGGQGLVLYSLECDGSGVANNNIDDLFAGEYTVCVTDAEGCTDQMDFTVSEPPVIEVTLQDITFPTCNGDSDGILCVNISGGNGGPYFTSSVNDSSTAEESNCIGGLESGSHVVYVWEDLTCAPFISQGFFVTQLGAVNLDANDFADASCADVLDGEIIVLGSGGVGPYEFDAVFNGEVVATITSPENTFTGLACGEYTINVADANGCGTSVSGVEVECPDPVELNTLEVSDVSCVGEEDGIIEVTGAGGNGTFQYNISDVSAEDAEMGPFNNTDGAFEDLTAGTYWVTASSSNCEGTVEFTVDAPEEISVEFLDAVEAVDETGECSICIDENSISGGTGDITWFWEPGFSTEACITGLNVGDVVSVSFSDDNGCEVAYEEVFTCTVGLFELENNISITMFPNPTSGVININAEGLNGQKVSAVITDALGASVQATDFGNISGVWNKEINITNEADGIYFITLTVDQEVVTYRVMKN